MEDEIIRRYLLGGLPETEREKIGERIVEDDEFHGRVCDLENDLIDACARGQLGPAEEQQLRRYLEETKQLDRLQFAAALSRAGGSRRRVWWMGASTAAAALLAVYLGAPYVSRQPRTSATAVPQKPQPSIARIFLPAGAVRSAGAVRVVEIPASASAIELELEKENPDPRGEVEIELKTAGGRAVLSEKRAANSLILNVPAKLLSAGSYEIAVTTTDPAGSKQLLNYYYFQVK